LQIVVAQAAEPAPASGTFGPVVEPLPQHRVASRRIADPVGEVNVVAIAARRSMVMVIAVIVVPVIEPNIERDAPMSIVHVVIPVQGIAQPVAMVIHPRVEPQPAVPHVVVVAPVIVMVQRMDEQVKQQVR
jgi:hypothetical protein